MLEVIGMGLAGLGITLAGVRILSSNARQLVSRRFRNLVERWTRHDVLAGLWGALFAALTQSGALVGAVLGSLLACGSMSLRRAVPVQVLMGLGLALPLLVLTFDIKTFTLFLVGLTGICYGLNRPVRFQNVVAAVLGVAFIYLGVQIAGEGAAKLSQYGWFRELIAFTRNYPVLAFAVGIVAVLGTNSSLAVVLTAIALTETDLLDLATTLCLLCGVRVGTGLNAYLYSPRDQVPIFQANLIFVVCAWFGAALVILDLVLEIGLGVPLLMAVLVRWSADVRDQIIGAIILVNLGVGASLSLVMSPIARLVSWLAPAGSADQLARPEFINEQALADPPTALELVTQEHLRVLACLPKFLERVRSAGPRKGLPAPVALHQAAQELVGEINQFLQMLRRRAVDPQTIEQLGRAERRQFVLVSLLEGTCQFALLVDAPSGSPTLRSLLASFVEGLDTLLWTALDALKTNESFFTEALDSMTQDRGPLLTQIRQTYLSGDSALGPDDRARC